MRRGRTRVASHLRLPLSGRLALLALLGLLILVLVGPLIAPAQGGQMGASLRLQPPSATHWFGTDNYGLDIFTRLMEGGRRTLGIAAATVALGLLGGLLLGGLSGFFGGRVDWVLMRINDALLSFPSILLALLFITVLGRGIVQLVLAMGLMFTPSFARVVRSGFLQLRDRPHVLRVQVLGASPWRIMAVHILPSVLASLSSATAIGFANAILTESSLSYLGLGIPPTEASWGRMLFDAQSFFTTAPWFALFPGLIILVAVLLAFVLGSALLTLQARRETPQPPAAAPALRSLPAPPVPDDAIVVVRGLEIGAAQREQPALVAGLNLALVPGRVTGLVGESGSGKTLSSLALADLLPRGLVRRAGSIMIAGVDPQSLAPQARRRFLAQRLALCYQDALAALNPLMTVGAQVAEPLTMQRGISETQARPAVLALFARLALEPAARVYEALPHELSGGMRQRALLAMALIAEPEILIADEVSAALDGEAADLVFEVLREAVEGRGMALLLISHDLALVRRHCDDLIVLHRGRVVEQGPTRQVLAQPESDYTRLLLAARPSFARREQLLGEGGGLR